MRAIPKKTPSKPPRALVLSAAQLECLSSPARVQLFEALQHLDGASAAELAAELGRSVHSLYYHLKGLQAVELIRVRELRRVAKRDEAIYEVSSKRLRLDRTQSDQAYNNGLIKTVRAMLRKAEAEHRSAREACSPSELFSVLRLQANLSSADFLELRKRVESLGRWIRKRDQAPQGRAARRVSVTCLGTPLVDPKA